MLLIFAPSRYLIDFFTQPIIHFGLILQCHRMLSSQVVIDDFIQEVFLVSFCNLFEILISSLQYRCRSLCSGRSYIDSLVFYTCNYRRSARLLLRLLLCSLGLYLTLCCFCFDGNLFVLPGVVAKIFMNSISVFVNASSLRWGLLSHLLVDGSNLQNFLVLRLTMCDAYCPCVAWQLSELSFINNELEIYRTL